LNFIITKTQIICMTHIIFKVETWEKLWFPYFAQYDILEIIFTWKSLFYKTTRVSTSFQFKEYRTWFHYSWACLVSIWDMTKKISKYPWLEWKKIGEEWCFEQIGGEWPEPTKSEDYLQNDLKNWLWNLWRIGTMHTLKIQKCYGRNHMNIHIRDW